MSHWITQTLVEGARHFRLSERSAIERTAKAFRIPANKSCRGGSRFDPNRPTIFTCIIWCKQPDEAGGHIPPYDKIEHPGASPLLHWMERPIGTTASGLIGRCVSIPRAFITTPQGAGIALTQRSVVAHMKFASYGEPRTDFSSWFPSILRWVRANERIGGANKPNLEVKL